MLNFVSNFLFMEFSANQIAEFLKGDIEGNGNVLVSDFSKIEEGKPGTLTFLSNPKYEPYLYTTRSSVILVSKTLVLKEPVNATLIRVNDPYQSLAQLLTLYNNSTPQKVGVDPNTHIASSAVVGENVYIGAFTVVGSKSSIGTGAKLYANCNIGDNVSIGKETVIYPGVTIYDGCKIGDYCVIHAGAVIGSDGFGFAPQSGDYAKIPQIGNVIIEDHVEIGANTTIDRATMGSTIIRKGVKLDNLIQVAHNVEIDENTVMAAQVGIAGSTKIGRNCMVGGQVGFAGHITVADGVKIGAQAGVANAIKKPETILLGSPAIDISNYRKSYAVFKGLPEINKTIYRLENEIKELKKLIDKKD